MANFNRGDYVTYPREGSAKRGYVYDDTPAAPIVDLNQFNTKVLILEDGIDVVVQIPITDVTLITAAADVTGTGTVTPTTSLLPTEQTVHSLDQLNDALAVARGGDSITLAPGGYQTWVHAGNLVTEQIKVYLGGTVLDGIDMQLGASNLDIHGGQILSGVVLSGLELRLYDMIIQSGTDANAVTILESQAIRIANSNISGQGYGVFFEGTDTVFGLTLLGNTITNDYGGCYFKNYHGVTCDSNDISGASYYGVATSSASTHSRLLLMSNTVHDCAADVLLEDVDGLGVLNNTFEDDFLINGDILGAVVDTNEFSDLTSTGTIEWLSRDGNTIVSGSDTTPPLLTVDTPSGQTTDTTPTFSGDAGVDTDDLTTITVKIYPGIAVTPTGLLQTLTVTATSTWTVDATILDLGVYVGRATQADSNGNTAVADVVFEIIAP